MKKVALLFSALIDERIRKLTGTTLKIYVISLITIPISTRLFGPDQFGVLNTFVAILCVLLIPAMLKLEVAVSISSSLIGASSLARTAFFSLTIYCGILSVAAIVFSVYDIGFSDEITTVIPLLPIGVFGAGLISLNAAFLTSMDRAQEINKLQYNQLVVTLANQIVFGVLGLTKYGLLLADVIGRNVRTLWMFNCLIAYDLYGPILSWQAIKREVSNHWRFPAFVMTGTLARYSLSYSIPIVVFHTYGAESAGFLAIAQRLAGLPRTLVGGAFNATLTADWRTQHLLDGFLGSYRVTSRLLLIILGVLMIAIAAVMIVATPMILGAAWSDVGVIVSILGGYYFLDAHLYALSAALQLRNLQYVGLISDVLSAIAQLVCLIIAFQMKFEFLSAVALVGAVGAVTLLLAEIFQYQALKRSL